MAELKTRPNELDAEAFVDTVEHDRRRGDCRKLMSLMSGITGAQPRMWGSSIVGFGSYRHRYRDGRENEWMLTGFSPRRQNLTIYVMPGFSGYRTLMSRLGRHTTGKSCLYIKSLADVDMDVLHELIERSVTDMKALEATDG